MTGRRSAIPVTQARLKEALHYEPATGVWTWRIDPSPHVKAGDVAGVRRSDGYLGIGLDGRRYMAHRLAWLYMKGEWPVNLIDHEDRDPSNNRWKNLRCADQVRNQHNREKLGRRNRAGLLGVTLANGKYPQSVIRINRKQVYLGAFDTADEAHGAYMRAKELVIELGPVDALPIILSSVKRRHEAKAGL